MGILEVKDVGKRFGGLKALSDVNLSVAENTCHAIIGPNGAGKSTLLNCLVGKLIPDTGSVMFQGQSVLGRSPHEINQMGISRVFQTPEIFGDLTVFENMMIPLFAKRDGAYRLHAIESVMNEKSLIEEAEKMLEEVNMLDKRHMHSASMSRGDKRRLEMAMCLVQSPKLLLLDEPTAGMARADTNNTIDLLKQIKDERDITIAIIEHDMHVVFSLADRITVLAQGTPLVEDTPDKIKGHPKVREIRTAEPHWPIASTNTTRIIWSAHHAIDGRWNGFGTFPEVCDEMLALARRRPDLDILFSPHPALITRIDGMTPARRARFDAFFRAWDALPNTGQLRSGQYLGPFAASDLLVVDGLSFLMEYQLLKKPVIYLSRPGSSPWNAMGEMVVAGTHELPSARISGIEALIDGLSNGSVPRKDAAQQALIDELTPRDDPARFIVDTIHDDLRAEARRDETAAG